MCSSAASCWLCLTLLPDCLCRGLAGYSITKPDLNCFGLGFLYGMDGTLPSFLRSAQRGGRSCLLQKKENLKTWQRQTREMKTYIFLKGETKKVLESQCTQEASFSLFLFCSKYQPKIKGEHPDLSIGDVAKTLGEMWNNTTADNKQPYEKKAAKLKEKCKKDTAV
ncbi:hypothetical protein GH733_016550 [Mirounga leonina]|nr:hypothetical protein GH733_016550 [Mirounga leonina]